MPERAPTAHVGDESRPHVDLVVHGDLSELSTEELFALRRVLHSTSRHVRRAVKRESGSFTRRWMRRWAWQMWVGLLPAYGLTLWVLNVYAGIVRGWPYIELVWRLMLVLWWPW